MKIRKGDPSQKNLVEPAAATHKRPTFSNSTVKSQRANMNKTQSPCRQHPNSGQGEESSSTVMFT